MNDFEKGYVLGSMDNDDLTHFAVFTPYLSVFQQRHFSVVQF